MSRHNRRRTRLPHKPYRTFQFSPYSTTPDYRPEPPIVQVSSVSGPVFQETIFGRRFRPEDFNSRLNNKRPSSACCYPPFFLSERQVAVVMAKEKEKAKVKEQIRIFGGEEEGDEDGLCDKMMEYFGGLDFI